MTMNLYLMQLVFQVAPGYEDANDSNGLRNDPVMKIVCGKQTVTDTPLSWMEINALYGESDHEFK